jgi:hypothetical protein
MVQPVVRQVGKRDRVVQGEVLHTHRVADVPGGGWPMRPARPDRARVDYSDRANCAAGVVHCDVAGAHLREDMMVGDHSAVGAIRPCEHNPAVSLGAVGTALIDPPHSATDSVAGATVEARVRRQNDAVLELFGCLGFAPGDLTARQPPLNLVTSRGAGLVAVEQCAHLLEEHRRLPVAAQMLAQPVA